MSKTKKTVLLTLSLICVVLAGWLGNYFYRNWQIDNTPEISPQTWGSVTKRNAAYSIVQRTGHYVDYISRCKRFPNNFEDMFHEHADDLKSCKPLPRQPVNVLEPYKENEGPWIDPWGRPYQLRYDRERRKLQVRSRGRYTWWPWDDIKTETNLAIPKTVADAERAKCDRGEACIFDRGWH